MKISQVDLDFIQLGIKNTGGCFDEKDIESVSELKKLGTGRVLDFLASLKDRGLVEMKNDGKFYVTNTAKQILWNEEIPLWIKILRILEIKSRDIEEIVKYIHEKNEVIMVEIEKMRKKGLLMITPIRTEAKLQKMYEILPEGLEIIKKIEVEGYDKIQLSLKENKRSIELLQTIDEVIDQIIKSEINQEQRNSIIEKLRKVQAKLEV